MMFQNCVEDKWGRIYESSSESDDDDEEEDGDGDWDDNDDEELEEEQDGIAEHHDVKNFRLVSSFLFLGLQETLCHCWFFFRRFYCFHWWIYNISKILAIFRQFFLIP